MPAPVENSRRIKVDEDLWRLIRAAAILEGIDVGEWLSRLARRELRAELAATGTAVAQEGDDDPASA